MEDERFRRYSTREAAKAVGCSHTLLYQLIRKGKVPHHKSFNGHAFFTAGDIEKILSDLQVQVPA